jgi:hypothetical protein
MKANKVKKSALPPELQVRIAGWTNERKIQFGIWMAKWGKVLVAETGGVSVEASAAESSAWALADKELEEQASILNASELRTLSRIMARWARQCVKVAAALDAAGEESEAMGHALVCFPAGSPGRN